MTKPFEEDNKFVDETAQDSLIEDNAPIDTESITQVRAPVEQPEKDESANIKQLSDGSYVDLTPSPVHSVTTEVRAGVEAGEIKRPDIGIGGAAKLGLSQGWTGIGNSIAKSTLELFGDKAGVDDIKAEELAEHMSGWTKPPEEGDGAERIAYLMGAVAPQFAVYGGAAIAAGYAGNYGAAGKLLSKIGYQSFVTMTMAGDNVELFRKAGLSETEAKVAGFLGGVILSKIETAGGAEKLLGGIGKTIGIAKATKTVGGVIGNETHKSIMRHVRAGVSFTRKGLEVVGGEVKDEIAQRVFQEIEKYSVTGEYNLTAGELGDIARDTAIGMFPMGFVAAGSAGWAYRSAANNMRVIGADVTDAKREGALTLKDADGNVEKLDPRQEEEAVVANLNRIVDPLVGKINMTEEEAGNLKKLLYNMSYNIAAGSLDKGPADMTAEFMSTFEENGLSREAFDALNSAFVESAETGDYAPVLSTMKKYVPTMSEKIDDYFQGSIAVSLDNQKKSTRKEIAAVREKVGISSVTNNDMFDAIDSIRETSESITSEAEGEGEVFVMPFGEFISKVGREVAISALSGAKVVMDGEGEVAGETMVVRYRDGDVMVSIAKTRGAETTTQQEGLDATIESNSATVNELEAMNTELDALEEAADAVDQEITRQAGSKAEIAAAKKNTGTESVQDTDITSAVEAIRTARAEVRPVNGETTYSMSLKDFIESVGREVAISFLSKGEVINESGETMRISESAGDIQIVLAEKSEGAIATDTTQAEINTLEDNAALVDESLQGEKGVDQTQAVRDVPFIVGEDSGKGVNAAYFKGMRFAVFTKNASASTVVHEWLHHLVSENMLPQTMMDSLLSEFGANKAADGEEENKVWDAKSHEALVEAFMAYIREGIIPVVHNSNNTAKIFSVLKDSVGASIAKLQESGYEISQDATDVFGDMIGAVVPGQSLQRNVGEAILERMSRSKDIDTSTSDILAEMENAPATKGASKSMLFNKISRLGRNLGLDPNKDLFGGGIVTKEALKLGHKSAKDLSLSELSQIADTLETTIRKEAHTLEDQAARDAGRESMEHLSEDEKASVTRSVAYEIHKAFQENADRVERRKTAKNLRDKFGMQGIEAKIVRDIKRGPKNAGAKARAAGGETQYRTMIGNVLNSTKEKAAEYQRRFGTFLNETSRTVWETALLTSDSDRRHAIFSTVNNMWNAMTKDFAYLMQTENENESNWQKKHGSIMINMARKYDIEGTSITHNEVLGIYLNVMNGEAKFSVTNSGAQALKKSNHIFRDMSDTKFASFLGQVQKAIANDKAWYVTDKKGKVVRTVYKKPKKGDFKETNPSTNLIGYMRDFNNRIHKPMSEVYKNTTAPKNGKPAKLGKVSLNYFTRERTDLDGTVDGDDWGLRNDVIPQGRRDKSKVLGATKERSAVGGGEINIQAVQVFERYKHNALNYVAKRERLTVLSNVFNNRDVVGAINEKYDGDSKVSRIFKDRIAEEYFVTQRTSPMRPAERFMRTIRTNFVTAVLWGNLSAMGRQVISGVTGTTMIKGADAYMEVLRVGTKTYSRLFFHSIRTLFGKDSMFEDLPEYQFMKKYDPVSANRRFEHTSLDTVLQSSRPGVMDKIVRGKTLRDWGMLGFRNMDMATVVPIWSAAYKTKMHALQNVKGMSNEAKRKESVEYAREVIRITQPPANMSERIPLQKGTEGEKMATMLTGQVMKEFNMFSVYMIENVRSAMNEARRKGHSPTLSGAHALLTGNYGHEISGGVKIGLGKKAAFGIFIPAVMLGMTYRKREPTEEEFRNDVLLYALTKLPFVGGILQSMYMADWTARSERPLHLQLGGTLTEVIGELYGKDTSLWDILTDEHIISDVASAKGIPHKLVGLAFETIRTRLENDEFGAEYLLRATGLDPKEIK